MSADSLGEQLERLQAVHSRTHPVTVLLEQTPQELAADRIVVRDEDRCRVGTHDGEDPLPTPSGCI